MILRFSSDPDEPIVMLPFDSKSCVPLVPNSYPVPDLTSKP